MPTTEGAVPEPGILYVDDERPNLDLFRRSFDERFKLHFASSGPEALKVLEREPNIGVLVSDQRMEPMTGIELLSASEPGWPLLTRMLLTAWADRDLLLQAIQRGKVHDYVLKPWAGEDLGPRLQAGLDAYKRRRELATAGIEREANPIDSALVGGLDALRAQITKIASADSTALIRGENGTGKELVARELHRRSARSRMPFVAVNCAALTPTLLQSELFGHEANSFPGAKLRIGRFELADGGTLFLDEIGEIPLEMQVTLLRVLQEREFERVGGTRGIKVNLRLITATNRSLESMVAAGAFREDLYHRIKVVPIDVPPLRARADDIDVLARHFLELFNHELHKHLTISGAAIEALKRHDWPGNVRELRNTMEHAAVMANDDTVLEPESFSFDVRPPPPPAPPAAGAPTSLRQELDAELADKIRKVLRQTNGNITAAAKLMGIARTTLNDQIRKLGIM